MNLDVTGIGEGVGNRRVAGGREVMGWGATVTNKL